MIRKKPVRAEWSILKKIIKWSLVAEAGVVLTSLMGLSYLNKNEEARKYLHESKHWRFLLTAYYRCHKAKRGDDEIEKYDLRAWTQPLEKTFDATLEETW